MKDEDYEFMLQAIERAKAANDEYGKVGTVLVQNNKVISASGSSSCVSPVVHAEHSALEKAGWLKKYERRKDSIIYVTLQPCIKRTSGANGCSFDIISSGVERVVYGCLDPAFNVNESVDFFSSREVIFEQIPDIQLQKECWNIFYKSNKLLNKYPKRI